MRNTDAHLDGAAELERLCFSSPWSRESLKLLTNDGIGVGFVCECEGKIAAYGGMLIAVDEGQITNVAVHPDYRRRGMAGAILNSLMRYAKSCHADSVTLEVRASNAAAIALYKKAGFVEVGRRRAFYTKPVEDAIIMTVKLK
ncbi:MAG: ribosomal protein S18-alanine N-acetyltransferase [Clostridia bacterium]|nr:ribosomal protein S18-alanine N-acetyltransferase [Clostridia bacterium]